MREILFKAKRLDNGEWVEGFLYIRKDGVSEINYYNKELDVERYTHEVDPNTICQFTELTDKNGNKIWENDIVVDDIILGTVVWDVKNARFVINDINDDYQDYSDWWNEVGVIGDIFDDYELLGEQNG